MITWLKLCYFEKQNKTKQNKTQKQTNTHPPHTYKNRKKKINQNKTKTQFDTICHSWNFGNTARDVLEDII